VFLSLGSLNVDSLVYKQQSNLLCRHQSEGMNQRSERCDPSVRLSVCPIPMP